MYTVVETETFYQWLSGLKDGATRIRLARRLNKVKRGVLGDVKPVGDGVMEMREFFGPGWRMYYIKQGSTIVVMLGGGDKSSQEHDIQRAKTLAQELKDAQDENPDPPV